tara:strand:- start:272 stop:586 length:315 start_codon:yes stop_codon:yes gene_type:complete
MVDEILTSEALESLEIENFESFSEQCSVRYRLEPDEMGWLEWIGGRYSISEYISDNLDDAGVVTLSPIDVSEALRADDVDRAPCLSENTQLQRLLWYFSSIDSD